MSDPRGDREPDAEGVTARSGDAIPSAPSPTPQEPDAVADPEAEAVLCRILKAREAFTVGALKWMDRELDLHELRMLRMDLHNAEAEAAKGERDE